MMAKRPKVSSKRGRKSLGRGFSQGELKKAGLSLSEAVRLHVAVDPRRKTAHDENVEAVRTILEEKKAAAKTRKKPKRKSKSQDRAKDDQ